jgi:exonuclease III
LSIFHCNIRSLRNKLNYIADIIEEFDIVFFTETHLDNQALDSDKRYNQFNFSTTRAIPIL